MYVDIQVTDLLRDCNPFRYIYIIYTVYACSLGLLYSVCSFVIGIDFIK